MSAISINNLSLIHRLSDAAHPKAGDNRESSGLAAPHHTTGCYYSSGAETAREVENAGAIVL